MSGLSVREALVAATQELSGAGIKDAARDVRRLAEHVLGLEAGRLTLVLPDPIADDALASLNEAVARRKARQPLAQITRRREFWGRVFHVTPDVLDPRPETETLVRVALAQPFSRVLDLGTGSGCILLTLLAERPSAVGQGVDASADALAVAKKNAVRLGLAERAGFAASDWFSAVSGRFDLIVANPPYIATAELATLEPEVRDWEPLAALCP
ncbi:MAG: N5-glutamine methyltransferase family protein, partial [Paracoccaceae bacterium]